MVMKYVKKLHIYRIYINILTFRYIRDVTRRGKPFPTLGSFRKKKKYTDRRVKEDHVGLIKKIKEQEDHVGLWVDEI